MRQQLELMPHSLNAWFVCSLKCQTSFKKKKKTTIIHREEFHITCTRSSKKVKKFNKYSTKLKMEKGKSDNKICWKRGNRWVEQNSQIKWEKEIALESI